MTVLDFHPKAFAELIAAVAWYEDQRAGLGAEFDAAVYRAIEIVAENPSVWQRWPSLPQVRVFRLARFPFLLPYWSDDAKERLVLLAIAHAKRRPGYWRNRIDYV